MLFVDGHKSHLTLELIDLACKKDVILFCLPSHITHTLQPLDVAVFKSFKDQFFKSVYVRYHFPSRILKVELSKAGIHPFNLNAVDPAKMKPSEF